MKIVVEGPNGSGKSTLCEELSKIYGLNIHHAGPKPKSTCHAISDCMDQLEMNKVIHDRITPISRVVYQDNLLQLELEWLRLYVRKFIEERSIFIFCTGKGEFTKKPYYPEGHYEEIMSGRKVIRDHYRNLFKMIDHLPYDFRVQTINHVKEYIDELTINYRSL